MEGKVRRPHGRIKMRVVHPLYSNSSFLLFSCRSIIMAKTSAAFRQLQKKDSMESDARQTDTAHVKRDLLRQRVRDESLASWVDEKEEEVEKLQKHVDQFQAKLLTAKQEIGRVRDSLTEEERKRHNVGLSTDIEALEAIKDALQENPGLLDDLMQAMPNLPLPSSMAAMLDVAEEAKDAVSRLKPELGSLVTQVADARKALEALKKQIQDEVVLRTMAAEQDEAQKESATLKSKLKEQTRELEAKLESAEANAEASKREAGKKLCIELYSQDG
jgi:septal ring factor EnvC (AmiA/AmiB activator)